MPMIDDGMPRSIEATSPKRLLALYYIVAISGLVVWIVITLTALQRSVDSTGLGLSVLLFGLFSLSVRVANFSNTRVMADDAGMRGTRFLGRPSSLLWEEVTDISEWQYLGLDGPLASAFRWIRVLEVHGAGTAIAVSELLDGYDDFVAVVKNRLAGVPHREHRLNLLSMFVRAYRRRGIRVR